MPTERKISRRTWLTKTALFTTAAGVSPLLPHSSSAEGKRKVSKSVAQYQDFPNQMRMCRMCKFFISADGRRGGMMGGGMMGGGMMGGGMMAAGTCEVVEGRISPTGYCVLYAPLEG
jgi:hypothetical protein